MAQEAIPSGHRCRLVMVDAMFTLLVNCNSTRNSLTTRIYCEHAQILAPSRRILGAIDIARQRFSSDLLDDDFWLHVNLYVIRRLQPDWKLGKQAEAAGKIHECFLSDQGLFTVDTRLLKAVHDLKQRGARLVIASNQRQATLHRLLEHFGVLAHFDAIYTSEELGVRKPNAAFWEQILKAENVGPEAALHIGNSPRSDAGAARLGIRTLIRDPKNELERFANNRRRRIAGLTPEVSRDLRECLKAGHLKGFSTTAGLISWLRANSHS